MRYPLVKTGVVEGTDPHVQQFRQGFAVCVSAWNDNMLGHYRLVRTFPTKAAAELVLARVSDVFSIDPALWFCTGTWGYMAEFEEIAARQARRQALRP